MTNSVNKINTHNSFPFYHILPLYRRRLNNRRKNILPGESGKFSSKELDLETGFYYDDVRYLDPKTSRWLSGDPALGDYLPGAPVDEEARKRNGNLPGQGGVFNLVNLHVYHYAGNNPVKNTGPDGRKSGLVTDSDGVLVAGHSAGYVEVYDESGASIGFEFYEVGLTKFQGKDITGGKTTLSSEELDTSSPYPLNLTDLGATWNLGSAAANSLGVEAGVTHEFLTESELKKRLEKYDRVIEFNTTQEQDKAIRAVAYADGVAFGKYNLFTNNCVQYISKALAVGGVNTTPFLYQICLMIMQAEIITNHLDKL